MCDLILFFYSPVNYASLVVPVISELGKRILFKCCDIPYRQNTLSHKIRVNISKHLRCAILVRSLGENYPKRFQKASHLIVIIC